MVNRWLSWLNCTLLSLACVLILGGVIYWVTEPSEIVCGSVRSKECRLPKSAFELSEEAYARVGEPILLLQQAPPALQLPDLRQQLIYYGKNGRPDAGQDHVLLHFSLAANNKEVASIKPKEKLYLIYDKKGSSGRYSFSPGNEKTSLWLEGNPVDNEAHIQVVLENDQGEFIKEPESFAQFKLPEKDFSRQGGGSFDVGGSKADGTLLAKQKAKWYGSDRFLEQHGGEDFKYTIGKQRVDFGENEDLYSVFIAVGDCLIWDNNKWKVITPGEASLVHPLLVVKKVDERLMSFELWDVAGKGKTSLNLLKASEPWGLQNSQALQHMFKFLGARTLTQCVFEINRERVILSPSDWLLLTPKGWQKLKTEEEIDQYVQRKLPGTLFVFEGISRKEEKQILLGTLYSPSRHESKPIELALQVGSKPPAVKETKDKETKEAVETGDKLVPPKKRK